MRFLYSSSHLSTNNSHQLCVVHMHGHITCQLRFLYSGSAYLQITHINSASIACLHLAHHVSTNTTNIKSKSNNQILNNVSLGISFFLRLSLEDHPTSHFSCIFLFSNLNYTQSLDQQTARLESQQYQ